MDDTFTVEVAGAQHLKYVDEILKTIEDAARDRGTGIAKRKPDYIAKKMMEGKAVIAMKGDVFAGFCYVECWEHGEFVANSGLIVKKEFRQQGLARRIKKKALELSQELFPHGPRRDEDQHFDGLCPRDLLGTDDRPGLLEGLRELRELRCPAAQQLYALPVHGHVV